MLRSDICELEVGGEVSLKYEVLPEWYHVEVEAGGKYELVWPGQDVDLWTWGSREENKDRLLIAGEEGLPKLVMPGGCRVAFEAEAEMVPWPGRKEIEDKWGFARANYEEIIWRAALARKTDLPRPVEVSERLPGTLNLVVTLDCPDTLLLAEDFKVKLTLTYDAPSSARPMTLHTYSFGAPYHLFLESRRDGLQCYRRMSSDDDGNQETRWELCDLDDGEIGFMLVDLPDREHRVSEDKRFVSLRPGETWSTTVKLHWPPDSLLPEDTKVGDVFRCQFNGVVKVDWWD
ncbi:hypothetical protein B0T16DRAFT_453463 [Cercophora newfieldiana]|uniref:Uncharacterized protein n=1 Tax=Cercophora newfieldiana TaxID=92897 RepID=A0AA39YTU0_9PEZI|nr:hypothetical protein B0T16DRAFT_453463 [Cercophora newfieldiana]